MKGNVSRHQMRSTKARGKVFSGILEVLRLEIGNRTAVVPAEVKERAREEGGQNPYGAPISVLHHQLDCRRNQECHCIERDEPGEMDRRPPVCLDSQCRA